MLTNNMAKATVNTPAAAIENIQYAAPTQEAHNAYVKTFKQTITDEETGLPVKFLYYLKIVRGNVTVQINVGEKTYTQIKTLTEEKIKEEK